MTEHPVVSHEEWEPARKKLIEMEKKFSKLRDQLTRLRQSLPWEKVEKKYTFEGPHGTGTLTDLFGDKSQLIVYPLHVRSRMEGRLQVMLVYRGSLQPLHRPLESSGRRYGHRFKSASREAGSLQETDGLELQMGLLIRERFQFGLPGLIKSWSNTRGRGVLQLQNR